MNTETRKQYMDTLRERYFKANKKEKKEKYWMNIAETQNKKENTLSKSLITR